MSGARSIIWVPIGLGVLFAPDPGGAASFVSGDFDWTYDLAVGGAAPAGRCYSSQGDACAISGSASPSVFGTGNGPNESEHVSTALGSDAVSVTGSASLDVAQGEVFRTDHSLDLLLTDSAPTSFHTSARGDISLVSSVILDTSTSVLPNQTLELSVRFVRYFSDSTPLVVTPAISGEYRVTDLDSSPFCESLSSCQTLASFSDDGSATLDITDINGHRLEISFDAEISTNQAPLFGGGSPNLADRVFSYFAYGQSRVAVVTPVPEPSTAALVALGLAALALRRTR